MARMTAVCEDCGGEMERVPDGMVGKLVCPATVVPGVREPYYKPTPGIPFYACSACEHCREETEAERRSLAAAALGRKGGRARTEAKRAAAQANGRIAAAKRRAATAEVSV